ncbi:hypothetical protein GMDG_08260 [Pseudogymnoascus destructans 20631-21]|uniref:Uncharacterized protein n=2 Tax=Pseudogymnoascus destructans TaxID=655981 RepID=L8G372_PSED2|nr:hypothetical protein GMDG_08260 [Pseudogymnoascus destructans 20631-21]
MTLVPPHRSKAFNSGLYFLQWYGSHKEILDAAKNYAFHHPDLLELAIDKDLWEANARSAKVTHARAYKDLVRSYLESKGRALTAMESSLDMSFGVRFESRITWALALEVKRQAAMRPVGGATVGGVVPSSSSYVWTLPTKTFVDFICGNINKITTAIELGILSSPASGLTKDRSNVLYILLLSLRAFSNAHLPSQPLLWRDEDKADRMGMGMERTVKECGYGWFLDHIQWDSFWLKDEIASKVPTFGATYIRMYHNSRSNIHCSTDALEMYSSLLRTVSMDAVKATILLGLISHVCFRQFRHDVRKTLKKDLLNPDDVKDDNSLKFSWEDDKYATNPSYTFNRKNFDKLPFRVMYKRSKKLVQECSLDSRSYEVYFKRLFFENHFVVPAPSTSGTLGSVAKDKSRRWFSIINPNTDDPVWGADDFVPGYPPPCPDQLDLDREALIALERSRADDRASR